MTAPALDPTQVLLGLNNGPGIYLAPPGTPPPADLVAPWATPWASLGYLSDDGVTLSSSTETDTLTPWQSVAPVRTVLTGKTLTLQMILWQTNPKTLAMYFDVPVPTVTAGVVNFDVRSDGGQQLYAVGLDIKDGAVTTRITFARASLSDTGDVAIQRGSALGWDCTLTALDVNGVLGHIISGGAGSGFVMATEAEAEAAEAAA